MAPIRSSARKLLQQAGRSVDYRAGHRTPIVLLGTPKICRAIDKLFPTSQVPALCRREWRRFQLPLSPLRCVDRTGSSPLGAAPANSLFHLTFDKCFSASRSCLTKLAKVRRPKRSIYRVLLEPPRTCPFSHRLRLERNARKRSSDPFRSLSENAQSLDRTDVRKGMEDLTRCR